MNVSILGTGAYGLALSIMLLENNCNIKMWTKFEEERNLLTSTWGNDKALPGIKIPSDTYITCDMQEAVLDSDLIIIVVPIAFFEDTIKELSKCVNSNQVFLIATKGIEQNNGLLPMDILVKYIDTDNYGVISGPSFAIDMANKSLTALTLAAKSSHATDTIKKALQNDFLVFSVIDDTIGTIICGAIKNVVAISSGIILGMNLSESTRAMFITEFIKETNKLITLLGGKKETTLDYAGVGDFFLTSNSIKSRNFQFGVMIGKKVNKEEIDNYISNTTLEGLYNIKSIYKLLNLQNIHLPLIDIVYNIVINGEDPIKLLDFMHYSG